MNLKTIISLILIAGILFLGIDTIRLSNQRKEIASDIAQLNHVQYGLLSVEKWKDKVSEILTAKIQDFQITNANRQEVSRSIDSVLKSLISEFEHILEENRTKGNFFSNAFASMFQSFVFDIDDLKRRLPEFREIILNELDNYETREKLRKYIQSRIDDLIYETIGEEDFSQVNSILDKYDLENYENRYEVYDRIDSDLDPKLNFRVFTIILLTLILLGMVFFERDYIESIHILLLTAVCFILLICGLLTPMLEIEARIDSFSFLLMGEPLSFENQILFYQGKSILDVVWILITQSSFQSILVGFLIFVFSVLFPLSKLLSIGYLSSSYNSSSRFLDFFAFYSGKWSMADVFVVAIFMAFIGFQGVIENQLSQLESIGSNVEIIATDHSAFGVGFVLFISFCICSMVLSYLLKRSSNFF